MTVALQQFVGSISSGVAVSDKSGHQGLGPHFLGHPIDFLGAVTISESLHVVYEGIVASSFLSVEVIENSSQNFDVLFILLILSQHIIFMGLQRVPASSQTILGSISHSRDQ